MQGAYTASAGGTTPEIKLDSTRAAIDIQDADTSLGGNLLNIRGSNGSGLGSILMSVNSSGELKVGTSASASLSGAKLLVTNAEVTTTLRVGDGTNGVEFSASGVPVYRGSARPTKKITLAPEYAGAVFTGDGTSNSGTMTSDFCSGSSLKSLNTGVCTSTTEEHNYYSWVSTSGTNDYDIYIRYQLPSDFDGFATSTSIQMYGWATTAVSDLVELALFNAAGAQCGSTTDVATSDGAWTETALTGDETVCSVAAGETVTFRIRLTSSSASNYARAGELRLDYRSKF